MNCLIYVYQYNKFVYEYLRSNVTLHVETINQFNTPLKVLLVHFDKI